MDIDGHKNSKREFDGDMLELQEEFLIGFLAECCTEINAPLVHAKNSNPQNSEIPPELVIEDRSDGATNVG